MPVSSARSAAFDILLRVERQSSYASELLHSESYERLTHSDHALATEIVFGVLRWRSRLDDEITTASSQPLAKLDAEILIALRIALYQLHQLDRVPARAAIHESVELVKRARKRSAAAFVNAVLRKLAVETKSFTSVAERADSSEELARTYAHPRWLVERWIAQYGLAATRKICEYDQQIPVTAIRLRGPQVEARLTEHGIRLSAGGLLISARRVESGDITKTTAFQNVQIMIQDEASQLVAALVSSSSNLKQAPEHIRILDCCAAPGGKTLAIADFSPEATITAVELHPHRARLLRKLIQASASSVRIHVLAADARHLPILPVFDCVLVDAPCSGSGTLGRHPEIKWRLTPADIADLHTRQVAILRAALAQVRLGGRLIYSTCSMEAEENERVVEAVLAENDSFHLRNCTEEIQRLAATGQLIWSDFASLTRGAYLRTIPGVHPCDGFFAAILERTQ
jgi:16S rRNA (cytosine967-C5)-methyltransferase